MENFAEITLTNTNLTGETNYGAYVSTIVVNFSSSGSNGGYCYGTNDIQGASGQIIVTGC
jgi:hypothetical protein